MEWFTFEIAIFGQIHRSAVIESGDVVRGDAVDLLMTMVVGGLSDRNKSKMKWWRKE